MSLYQWSHLVCKTGEANFSETGQGVQTRPRCWFADVRCWTLEMELHHEEGEEKKKKKREVTERTQRGHREDTEHSTPVSLNLFFATTHR